MILRAASRAATAAAKADAAERRGSLRPDVSCELRLNLRGEILLIHRYRLLDRLARVVVDLRPARRTDDHGDRVGLRAVLDDGRGLWFGEACNVMASALAIAHRICVVRVEGDSLDIRVAPLISTLELGDRVMGVTPGTIGSLVRHFDSAVTCVALTSQPGNPEPDVPLLTLVRRLSRPRASNPN